MRVGRTVLDPRRTPAPMRHRGSRLTNSGTPRLSEAHVSVASCCGAPPPRSTCMPGHCSARARNASPGWIFRPPVESRFPVFRTQRIEEPRPGRRIGRPSGHRSQSMFEPVWQGVRKTGRIGNLSRRVRKMGSSQTTRRRERQDEDQAEEEARVARPAGRKNGRAGGLRSGGAIAPGRGGSGSSGAERRVTANSAAVWNR